MLATYSTVIREIDFSWVYLIHRTYDVYKIVHPLLKFPNNGGVSGNGGSVFESSQEVKLKNSKDKGLKPLMRFIESIINKLVDNAGPAQSFPEFRCRGHRAL